MAGCRNTLLVSLATGDNNDFSDAGQEHSGESVSSRDVSGDEEASRTWHFLLLLLVKSVLFRLSPSFMLRSSFLHSSEHLRTKAPTTQKPGSPRFRLQDRNWSFCLFQNLRGKACLAPPPVPIPEMTNCGWTGGVILYGELCVVQVVGTGAHTQGCRAEPRRSSQRWHTCLPGLELAPGVQAAAIRRAP